MPEPREGESQQEFISRCIRVVKQENPEKTTEQAAGQCYGMWEQSKKRRSNSSSLPYTNCRQCEEPHRLYLGMTVNGGHCPSWWAKNVEEGEK